MFTTLAEIFPSLGEVRGQPAAALEPFEQVVLNDKGLTGGLLAQLGIAAEADSFAYKRVQTLLLGGLEFVRAYGASVLQNVPKKLPNVVSDLDYATLASVAEGIATKDKGLARIVRLLKPGAIVEG